MASFSIIQILAKDIIFLIKDKQTVDKTPSHRVLSTVCLSLGRYLGKIILRD